MNIVKNNHTNLEQQSHYYCNTPGTNGEYGGGAGTPCLASYIQVVRMENTAVGMYRSLLLLSGYGSEVVGWIDPTYSKSARKYFTFSNTVPQLAFTVIKCSNCFVYNYCS